MSLRYCFLLIFLCWSCSQKPAQIVDHSSSVYNKRNYTNKRKAAEASKPSKPKASETFEAVEVPAPDAKVNNAPVLKPEAPINVTETPTPKPETYKVQPGDTVYSISKRYKLTPDEFAQRNNLQSPYVLKTGASVAVSNVVLDSKSDIKPASVKKIAIGSGDTLYGISRKYQVTIRDLIKENNLEPPYKLRVGSQMVIPVATYHEIKSGDTLYAISRLYNMKMDELVKINDMSEPYAVKVGDKIRISKITPTVVANVTPTPIAPIASATPAPTSKTITATPTQPSEPKPAEPKKVFDVKIATKDNRFSWPADGKIISRFGPKTGGLYNDGINIKLNEGSEVKSAEDGLVAYVGNELKGYGNLVIVKHSGGWITAYAHLRDTFVTRGQKVNKGEKIASVGSTGSVTSPQLYFGLRKGRDAVNPENYLR